MVITKFQGPSTYALTSLSHSELRLITLALVEFQKPFGVKNGYQDFAKQLYEKILAEIPEVSV